MLSLAAVGVASLLDPKLPYSNYAGAYSAVAFPFCQRSCLVGEGAAPHRNRRGWYSLVRSFR